MSTLHAPASVFPFQTPAPRGTFTPSTGRTSHLPNAAHEHLDPGTVAELNAWTDEHEQLPTPEEVDRMAAEHRGVELDTDGFFSDFIDHLSGKPQFPEVLTWKDDQLMCGIALADERSPGMNLHPVGLIPDRHEAFINEATAELLRRLDARTAKPVRVAA